MSIREVTINETDYPRVLIERLNSEAPPFISVMGNQNLISDLADSWAIIGSTDFVYEKSTEYFDLIEFFAKNNILVISGFHSPIEKLGLSKLMEFDGNAVCVLARSLYKYRIQKLVKQAFNEKRILFVSTTMPSVHRTCVKLTLKRNTVACCLASNVLVLSQNPRSKTIQLANFLKKIGLKVFQLSQNKELMFEDFGI